MGPEPIQAVECWRNATETSQRFLWVRNKQVLGAGGEKGGQRESGERETPRGGRSASERREKHPAAPAGQREKEKTGVKSR